VFEAMIEPLFPPFHHPNTFLAASVGTGIILTLSYLDQCVSNWVARNLGVPHRDDRVPRDVLVREFYWRS
jgi:hypothetical protein